MVVVLPPRFLGFWDVWQPLGGDSPEECGRGEEEGAGHSQQEEMGTLMARITQAMSILLRQMVALCWGFPPSAT